MIIVLSPVNVADARKTGAARFKRRKRREKKVGREKVEGRDLNAQAYEFFILEYLATRRLSLVCGQPGSACV